MAEEEAESSLNVAVFATSRPDEVESGDEPVRQHPHAHAIRTWGCLRELCSSPGDTTVGENRRSSFYIASGFYFVGTLLGLLRALLELPSAAMQYQHHGSIDDDDDDENDEWIYHDFIPLFLHWNILKLLDVSSTFLYLVSAGMGLYPDDRHQGDDATTWGSSARSKQGWVAVLFGIGAFLDLSSCILMSDDNGRNSEATQIMSMLSYDIAKLCADLFFASALLEIAAHVHFYQCCCCSGAESHRTTNDVVNQGWIMLLTADLLFLLGATVDVVIAHTDQPNETDSQWLWESIGGLLSAMCWLLNSVIGTIAEMMIDLEEEDNIAVSSNASDASTIRDDSSISEQGTSYLLLEQQPHDEAT